MIFNYGFFSFKVDEYYTYNARKVQFHKSKNIIVDSYSQFQVHFVLPKYMSSSSAIYLHI